MRSSRGLSRPRRKPLSGLQLGESGTLGEGVRRCGARLARGGDGAVARADEQIKAIRALAEEHPETWTLAATAADIRRAASEGKLAALMGLEGGYAIDEKIESVEHYYRAGVRYMSPTWTYSLSWAGSSGDAEGQSRGLNDFGRRVVREMNRLGMMVDVSHGT